MILYERERVQSGRKFKLRAIVATLSMRNAYPPGQPYYLVSGYISTDDDVELYSTKDHETCLRAFDVLCDMMTSPGLPESTYVVTDDKTLRWEVDKRLGAV